MEDKKGIGRIPLGIVAGLVTVVLASGGGNGLVYLAGAEPKTTPG